MNPGKALAIAFSLLMPFCAKGAEARVFDWYKTAASAFPESGTDVAVDATGSVYWGVLGPNTTVDGTAYVIKKFSNDGTQIWLREMRMSSGYDEFGFSRLAINSAGEMVALEAKPINYTGSWSEGNFFWSGGFAKINSAGTTVFTGMENIVIGWGYTREPFRGGAAIDGAGNCYFAFPFNQVDWRGVSYPGAGLEGAIIKLTPTGGMLWFKRVVGTGLNVPTGLVNDAEANIYVCGFSEAGMAFDATTLASNGGRDGFVAKYDAAGNLKWVQRAICSSDDTISGIALVDDGTIWFTGTFRGTITFGASISAPNGGTYLARLNPENGQPISLASLGNSDVVKLVPSPSGRALMTGKFSGETVMGVSVANRGGDDVFLAEINSVGTAAWVKTFGYVNNDTPGGVVAVSGTEAYVTARVNTGVILDERFVSGGSSDDAVLVKVRNPNASNVPIISEHPFSGRIYAGGQSILRVIASSQWPLTFQWYKDGVAMAGQTETALNISSVRPEDGGSYYVEVTNQYGTVRSEAVRLVVAGEAPVSVTTLAGGGPNAAGFVDNANGALARFFGPDSLAIQNDGVLVAPDAGNNAVRLVEASGATGTLAGKGPGMAGLENGPASAALFFNPIGVAVAPSWDIFVADGFNHAVRRISAFGVRSVTTWAGTGVEGFANGPGAQAQFQFPNDLVTDEAGNVFVTEFRGHRVRRISTDGMVTTFAGTGAAGYQDGAAGQAQFNGPAGIARDAAGNLYVTEWENDTIRKITPGGVVSTIAGRRGARGFVDGPALTEAKLSSPNGIAADRSGNIFFTEFGNSSVRRIDALGDVLTLVGTAGVGFANGGRTVAKMQGPGGIAVHPDGSLMVADTGNHAIRKVVWQANVTPTEAVVLIGLNPSITIFGEAGKTYRIEVTEDLVTPRWVVLGEVTLAAPVETWFDSLPATRGERYYRAVRRD